MKSQEEFDRVLTDDMALVTYLKIKGHTVVHAGYTDGVCRWEFSGSASDDARDFMEDRATVDPKQFSRVFGLTKRDMFALQNHH
jgi:hypothetical protein